ncbi:hypothetical protein EDB80DRAFT_727620 [Ilyonectria destructans]|nr:hypothetical protein EDB80DRAFT_727620 [Ilyonectria destructans]
MCLWKPCWHWCSIVCATLHRSWPVRSIRGLFRGAVFPKNPTSWLPAHQCGRCLLRDQISSCRWFEGRRPRFETGSRLLGCLIRGSIG